MSERVEALKGRLQKGIEKTLAIFGSIQPGQWEVVLYEQPPGPFRLLRGGVAAVGPGYCRRRAGRAGRV